MCLGGRFQPCLIATPGSATGKDLRSRCEKIRRPPELVPADFLKGCTKATLGRYKSQVGGGRTEQPAQPVAHKWKALEDAHGGRRSRSRGVEAGGCDVSRRTAQAQEQETC